MKSTTHETMSDFHKLTTTILRKIVSEENGKKIL